MKKLLKLVVRTYVIMKVTPVIIKGVGFMVECLAIGVGTKVSEAIFPEDVEKKKARRHLRRYDDYSYKSYNEYDKYKK